MSNKYISWIPNTSGMLLYSLVEPFDYRIDRIVGDVFEIREGNKSVNDKDCSEPFLISMLVDLRDFNEKSKSSKYTRIIFTATPNEDCSKLNGKIYFLDNLERPGLYKDETEITLIKKLSESHTKDKWDEIVADLIRHYKRQEDPHLVYSILEYTLEETGKIIIEHKEHRHQLEEKLYRVEVEQAYYFIKFIFHKDRFHSQKNEYIVPITKENGSPDDNFLNIAKGIIRHIVSRRKENAGNFLVIKSLRGMITYVKVLLNLIGDSEIRNKELTRVGFIDKGLENELDQLRPISLPNFKDFLDDFKSWSVIVFAIITPFIITSKHTFSSLEDYTLNMALPYYGYGMLVVIGAIFAIRIIILKKSYKSCFFVRKIGDIVVWTVLGIKKRSKPTIGTKLHTSWYEKYFFPFMVDIGMKVKRLDIPYKKIMGILLIAFFASIVSIGGWHILQQRTQPYHVIPPKHMELNSTLESNEIFKSHMVKPALPN